MKTWLQLTPAQRSAVADAMMRVNGRSVNGVAGWYLSNRARLGKIPVQSAAQHPRDYRTGRYIPARPTIRNHGIATPDDAPEPLTLDEIRDVLPIDIRWLIT